MSKTEQLTPLHLEWEGWSKTEIKKHADQVVSDVYDNGEVLKVAEALKVMEEFVATVRKDEKFVSYLREELQKNNGVINTLSGAKIESCETGVSYDYSMNPDWVHIEEQIKFLTKQKKSLEERLKNIPPGKILVDEETGETLIGAAKSSTSSYKITLAK